MGKIFDKLFLQKAEQINSDIEKAHKILEESQEQINEIKNTNNVEILFAELKKVILQYGDHRFHMGHSISYRLLPPEDLSSLNKYKQEIQDIIDELKSLMKEPA